VVGFLLGGLNLQIEHHLFPSMARPFLRQVRGLVQAHCHRHGVTYTETTLAHAYGDIVRHLNAVGAAYRDPFRCPMLTMYRG